MTNFGSLSPFVSNLYQDLYGRTGSPDEVAYWSKVGDPSAILDSFLSAPEYRDVAIPQMYQDILGRQGDQGGIDFYSKSGMSLDDIASAMMGSDEAARITPVASQATDPGSVQMGPDMPLWLKPFDFGDAKTPLDQISKWYSDLFGRNAAAGALGNFATESGLNPMQPQTRTGLPDGTPYLDKNGNFLGYGLSQLGGYRLNGPDPNNGSLGLMDFAKQYGMDPNSTETQLRHQLYEMQDGWLKNRNLVDALKNAKSSADAAAIFMRGYERPGKPNWTDRARNTEIFNQYLNNGLNGLTQQQRDLLMNWQNRTNPIPQVNPNIDTQRLGPSIDMSSANPVGAFGSLAGPTDPLTKMPSYASGDPSTALLGNQNINPFTGNPVSSQAPQWPDMTDWTKQLGITSPTFTTASFASSGAQQPGTANPFLDPFSQGSGIAPAFPQNSSPFAPGGGFTPLGPGSTPTFDFGSLSLIS